MFEEALEPLQTEMTRLMGISMLREAAIYCKGILKGIYDFHTESRTEYKAWAEDVPDGFFNIILKKWRSVESDQKRIGEMLEFIEAECPMLSEDAGRILYAPAKGKKVRVKRSK
jgi:hypothetical protein